MKEKSNSAVSVIGGADGPTSVFIVGRTGKKPFRMRFWDYIHQCKRHRVEKKIVATPHTLQEVAQYAMEKYSAVEVPASDIKYIEKRKSAKEGLIIKYRSELLGDMLNIEIPTHYDEAAIKALNQQIQERSKRIAEIPDSEIPMDFHVYEVRKDKDTLDIDMDYKWNIFAVSYGGGSKKAMKQFQKIAKELYLYYGVTEEDIRNKTERYSHLVAILSM